MPARPSLRDLAIKEQAHTRTCPFVALSEIGVGPWTSSTGTSSETSCHHDLVRPRENVVCRRVLPSRLASATLLRKRKREPSGIYALKQAVCSVIPYSLAVWLQCMYCHNVALNGRRTDLIPACLQALRCNSIGSGDFDERYSVLSNSHRRQPFPRILRHTYSTRKLSGNLSCREKLTLEVEVRVGMCERLVCHVAHCLGTSRPPS